MNLLSRLQRSGPRKCEMELYADYVDSAKCKHCTWTWTVEAKVDVRFRHFHWLRFVSINDNRRVKCMEWNNISEYLHAVENSLHLPVTTSLAERSFFVSQASGKMRVAKVRVGIMRVEVWASTRLVRYF